MKTAKTTMFDFIESTAAPTADSRKLIYTDQLMSVSRNRAVELLKFIAAAEADDKSQYVSAITEGKAEGLINLIKTKFTDEDIKSDSEFMKDASDEDLSKLLESRRSDRSKKLKEGPLSSITTAQNFLAAMYAELLVRQAWDKPYAAPTVETEIDENDLNAIGRKIKSLQTKKCRLGKIAPYDENAKAELEEVITEIARLNSFRPTIKSKTVVKSQQTEAIREALRLVQTQLSPEQLDQFKKAGLL